MKIILVRFFKNKIKSMSQHAIFQASCRTKLHEFQNCIDCHSLKTHFVNKKKSLKLEF